MSMTIACGSWLNLQGHWFSSSPCSLIAASFRPRFLGFTEGLRFRLGIGSESPNGNGTMEGLWFCRETLRLKPDLGVTV
jgi:hypothetical protein